MARENSPISVDNLTRRDGREFMTLRLESTVTRYALVDANRALSDLRNGRLEGAAVITS